MKQTGWPRVLLAICECVFICHCTWSHDARRPQAPRQPPAAPPPLPAAAAPRPAARGAPASQQQSHGATARTPASAAGSRSAPAPVEHHQQAGGHTSRNWRLLGRNCVLRRQVLARHYGSVSHCDALRRHCALTAGAIHCLYAEARAVWRYNPDTFTDALQLVVVQLEPTAQLGSYAVCWLCWVGEGPTDGSKSGSVLAAIMSACDRPLLGTTPCGPADSTQRTSTAADCRSTHLLIGQLVLLPQHVVQRPEAQALDVAQVPRAGEVAARPAPRPRHPPRQPPQQLLEQRQLVLVPGSRKQMSEPLQQCGTAAAPAAPETAPAGPRPWQQEAGSRGLDFPDGGQARSAAGEQPCHGLRNVIAAGLAAR